MKYCLYLFAFIWVPLIGCSQPAYHELMVDTAYSQKEFSATVKAGNYSGITRIKDNLYALVNDKSPKAGFYLFTIDLDSYTGMITEIGMDTVMRTSNEPNRDEEGICYFHPNQTVFVSGEADNQVIEYNLDGSLTGRKLDVQHIFDTARPNKGLESLTYNPTTRLFWTATEGPLPKDGEEASSTNLIHNRIRLQSFGEDLAPQSQFAYLMDLPIERDSITTNSQTGVSDLIALDDGRLIVLERELFFTPSYVGSTIHNKLYVVNPVIGKPVSNEQPLTEESPYLEKALLCEWSTMISLLRYDLANFEGMCLGPDLADGTHTIILVSDSQDQYKGILKDWFKVITFR